MRSESPGEKPTAATRLSGAPIQIVRKRMPSHWTADAIPDLTGKNAVVTGSSSGIGFETARALAVHGATVILACRNMEKARAAAARILGECPSAKVRRLHLDLSDLASVRRFAGEFGGLFEKLDILVNNAGILLVPFGRTADGFELHFGVNHLGHFALTGLLIDRILGAPGARVVTVASASHLVAAINFENLNGEKGYSRWRAYTRSKLANLLFTFELQRRFERLRAGAAAVAAHPGWTATNLFTHWPAVGGLSKTFAQSAAMGALPTLYAAAASGVRGGEYFGPGGFLHLSGFPVRERAEGKPRDPAAAARLWKVSETMTGVYFLDPPAG
jgi:NAD(P)-dependent dehydrogenase (short-subunit alcohol dehydrogenase family)